MQASNYSELCAMLLPAVKTALTNMAESEMLSQMEAEVCMVTGRGDWYDAGGAGSLSQAWSVENFGDGVMFTYDSSRLVHDDIMGRHTTPIGAGQYYDMSGKSESIDDMATLIDLGLGGMLFGKGNPTQKPTHFWDAFMDSWDANKRKWIIAGLEGVGLPVVYKGFI